MVIETISRSIFRIKVCRREKINTVVGIGKGVTFQARTWCVASQSKSSYVSTELKPAGSRRALHIITCPLLNDDDPIIHECAPTHLTSTLQNVNSVNLSLHFV